MIEEKKSKVNLFDSPKLNQLASDIIELDNQYSLFLKQAEKNIFSAFETRYKYGKHISENYEHIIDECGTQKAFAERIRKSEAVISNNKRAYENLLEWGCKDFDDVKKLLGEKQIRPTISNFEKIGTLLNEPDSGTKQEDQIPKDRKRLEELMEEVGEIVKRNIGDGIQAHADVADDALDFLEDVKEIKEYLKDFDMSTLKFNSEKYLNFVRNFGMDVITKEPCEKCDPHHIDAGSGKRQNDLMTIPVSRKTHNEIHYGLLEVSNEKLKDALIFTMSIFIKTALKK